MLYLIPPQMILDSTKMKKTISQARVARNPLRISPLKLVRAKGTMRGLLDASFR